MFDGAHRIQALRVSLSCGRAPAASGGRLMPLALSFLALGLLVFILWICAGHK
jgi:hypothetical protein